MKIVYEFFNCEECPYCKKGYSYGTDGRGEGIDENCLLDDIDLKQGV